MLGIFKNTYETSFFESQLEEFRQVYIWLGEDTQSKVEMDENTRKKFAENFYTRPMDMLRIVVSEEACSPRKI
jgi:hypothetical protein